MFSVHNGTYIEYITYQACETSSLHSSKSGVIFFTPDFFMSNIFCILVV